MRKFLLILPLLALGSCVQYSLVPKGPEKVGPYQFTLDRAWNKAPGVKPFPRGTQLWTADGLALDSMIFWAPVKAGDTLFNGAKSNPYPAYRAGMLPTDIEDWVKESLKKSMGEGSVLIEAEHLRPVKVDGKTAFEFDLRYATSGNIDYRGKVLVIPEPKAVGVILYRATAIHYYNDLLPSYKTMMDSLRVNAG